MPPSRKLVVTDPEQLAALRRRGIKDPGTGYLLCGDQCQSCLNNGLGDRGAGSMIVSDVRGHYNPSAGVPKWTFPQAGDSAFDGVNGYERQL